MSFQCNICGKKVSSGFGQDTSYGFVCFDCYNARDFQLCVECGRRFPRDEMLEWHGLLYCRNDYFFVKARYERILEEDRKKKAEKEAKSKVAPATTSSAVSIKPTSRIKLAKEDIKGIIGEIHDLASQSQSNQRTYFKKTMKTEEMKDKSFRQEKEDELLFILRGIEAISTPIENFGEKTFGSTLGSVSLSKKAKNKRKDEFREILDELNSLLNDK